MRKYRSKTETSLKPALAAGEILPNCGIQRVNPCMLLINPAAAHQSRLGKNVMTQTILLTNKHKYKSLDAYFV